MNSILCSCKIEKGTPVSIEHICAWGLGSSQTIDGKSLVSKIVSICPQDTKQALKQKGKQIFETS